MRSDTILRFLFVLYCAEAGIFLLLTPWSGIWSRLTLQMPWIGAHDWFLGAWPRAAVSGFGLVHLVWAVHDLDLWLRERSRTRRAQP